MSKAKRTKQEEVKSPFAKKDLLYFFEQMLLIRQFELKVRELYRAGELPGFNQETRTSPECIRKWS